MLSNFIKLVCFLWRNLMKKNLMILSLLPLALSVVGCKQSTKEYLKLWQDYDQYRPLTVLKNYVEDVTNINSKNFIPVEDRIATFDMDGTFIGELYATYFEYNMLEYRALEDPTYTVKDPYVVETANDIRNFVRNGTPLPKYDDDHGFDLKHAHAAAKAYAGMSVTEFDTYVKTYARKTPFGFTGMTYATSFYKPMLEVFDYLNDNNFTCYVVSGMDVMTKASDQGDEDGVNYTMNSSEELIRTDELIIKNLKTNKAKQISQEIGKIPVLSFGNSSGDSAMHNYCKSNPDYKTEVFMLIADDEERDHVNMEETRKREEAWDKAKYNVISMKHNFKTIYGDGVEKVNLPWQLK